MDDGIAFSPPLNERWNASAPASITGQLISILTAPGPLLAALLAPRLIETRAFCERERERRVPLCSATCENPRKDVSQRFLNASIQNFYGVENGLIVNNLLAVLSRVEHSAAKTALFAAALLREVSVFTALSRAGSRLRLFYLFHPPRGHRGIAREIETRERGASRPVYSPAK